MLYIIAILSSCVEGVINVGIDFTPTNNAKRILFDLVVCWVRNVLSPVANTPRHNRKQKVFIVIEIRR